MFNNEEKHLPLSLICEHFGDGDWIESKDQSEEGIRLIQTGNIGDGEYVDKSDKARFISEETFDRLSCTEVLPGDILVSRLPDPIGRACIVPSMQKSITAVDCTIIRLKEDILPAYFVAYTRTPTYQAQIDSFTTGSTRKRVSRANLGKLLVPIPNINKQRRFIEIANQSDKSKFTDSNRTLSRCLVIYIRKGIIRENNGKMFWRSSTERTIRRLKLRRADTRSMEPVGKWLEHQSIFVQKTL